MRIYVCLHKNNPPGRLTVRPFLSFAMLIAIAAAVPNNAHMFGSVTNPPRKQAIAFKSFFFFVNPYNGVERGTRFNRKTCCVILVRSLLYFICLCKPIQLQQRRLFVCFLSPLALLTVNVHFHIHRIPLSTHALNTITETICTHTRISTPKHTHTYATTRTHT